MKLKSLSLSFCLLFSAVGINNSYANQDMIFEDDIIPLCQDSCRLK